MEGARGLFGLVAQEFYPFVLAHYCARHLMHEAALANDIEPNRLSFTCAIEILKRKMSAYKLRSRSIQKCKPVKNRQISIAINAN